MPEQTLVTYPKRPFGRSLADFRLEGAATEHGLYVAEEKLLQLVAKAMLEPEANASYLYHYSLGETTLEKVGDEPPFLGRRNPASACSSGRYHISDPGSPLKGPTSSGVTQPP